MKNYDREIGLLLTRMREVTKARHSVYEILKKHGVEDNDIRPLVSLLTDEGLIQPVADTGGFFITYRGCEVVDAGGYEKYATLKREDDELAREARKASLKMSVYSRNTRWASVASLIIASLSLVISFLLRN
jgi:hypothetical protein